MVVVSIFLGEQTEKLAQLAAWAILPCFSMLVLSYVMAPVWFPRYLMLAAPYLLIFIATGFTVIWHWRKKLAIAVAVVYLVGAVGGLRDYYSNLYRNDWQGAARYIEAEEKAGDTIAYFSVPMLYDYSLMRYYQGNSTVHFFDIPNRNESVSRRMVEQELQGELPIKSRLWLVCWRYCDDQQSLDAIAATAVGNDPTLVERKVFKSMEYQPIQISVFERSQSD